MNERELERRKTQLCCDNGIEIKRHLGMAQSLHKYLLSTFNTYSSVDPRGKSTNDIVGLRCQNKITHIR